MYTITLIIHACLYYDLRVLYCTYNYNMNYRPYH
nr:MAG TPA: hypothetical protein [Caudoviricetes sp.]